MFRKGSACKLVLMYDLCINADGDLGVGSQHHLQRPNVELIRENLGARLNKREWSTHNWA